MKIVLASFGTRWERTFERHGVLEVQLNLRDLWVGVFVDPLAVYVCPLPCVVLRWSRGTKQDPLSYMKEAMNKVMDEVTFQRLHEGKWTDDNS
jgi:hypothetical protein